MSSLIKAGLILFGLRIVFPGTVLAVGATGSAFLNLPLSVQQLGMGDVSVGGRDVLRAWSNPAMLSRLNTKKVVALSGSSMFGGEYSTFGFGGGWVISPRLALGGFLSAFGSSLDELDDYGDSVGSILERSVLVGGVVTALKLAPWLQVGGTLKGVRDEITGNSSNVAAVDFGLVAGMTKLWGAVAFRNAGFKLRSYQNSTVGSDVLPFEVRTGIFYQHRARWPRGGVEYVQTLNRDDRLGIGVEWWLTDSLGLRTGISDIGWRRPKPTIGLSGAYRQFGLDYAFGRHVLGDNHLVSVSYAFGGSTDKWE